MFFYKEGGGKDMQKSLRCHLKKKKKRLQWMRESFILVAYADNQTSYPQFLKKSECNCLFQ